MAGFGASWRTGGLKTSQRGCRTTGRMLCSSVSDYIKREEYFNFCVEFLVNIKSYSGGTKPWKQKAGTQSTSDNLVEVVAMDNVDLALLNIGGTGESVCQARSVVIETTKAVPIQVDGEPLLVNPFRLKIEYNNSAWMLTKKRTSCKLQNTF